MMRSISSRLIRGFSTRAHFEPTDTTFSTFSSRLVRGLSTRAHFDPTDTKAVFGDKSTAELLFSAALYKLCGYRSVVNAASFLLAGSVPVVSPLARAAVRRTVLPLFVSGEDMSACVETAAKLRAFSRVTTILDHNVEERETEDAWDLNLQNKLALLHKLGGNADVRFVPLKCTALLCPKLLERMTTLMLRDEAGGMGEGVLALLTAEERLLLASGTARIETLCEAAAKQPRLSILLDAEQSHRQPAIEFIAAQLARKFNTDSRCLVYNTYQMYLKRSSVSLQRDLDEAQRGGYVLGVKLVRGAYISTERLRAEDPILASKTATDVNYNAAVSSILAGGVQTGTAALLVATHNRASVEHAVATMDSLGLPRDHPAVHFGSLMGMVDNVSTALGFAGFNSCKLLSFGTFEDILPWLLRRLQENQVSSRRLNRTSPI